jgi:hypothetical protein
MIIFLPLKVITKLSDRFGHAHSSCCDRAGLSTTLVCCDPKNKEAPLAEERIPLLMAPLPLNR